MLILASASPRRRELLTQAGLVFEVHAAHIDEARLPYEAPETYVHRLALEKARAIHARFPDAIVIGADTTVVFQNEIMNKPKDAANAERMRNGMYWSGDLAYRDADGWFWFAGRGGDWLRVDSENLAAGPIERVLVRFADVAAVAVYPVPDPRTGDEVMAALELLPGRVFDPDAFGAFLVEQRDLGTKWTPAFLRVTAALPVTASGKVTKESLRRDGWWRGEDALFRRRWESAGSAPVFDPMAPDDVVARLTELNTHGRSGLVGG